MAESHMELTLRVPKWILYDFLNEIFRKSRLAGAKPGENLMVDRPATSTMDPSKVDALVERLKGIARSNPWLGKDLAEIVAILEKTKPKKGQAASMIESAPISPSPSFRVVEDVPSTLLIAETTIGLHDVRLEIKLGESGSDTRARVSVKELGAEMTPNMLSIQSSIVQVLNAFEAGYLAYAKSGIDVDH